MVLEGVIDGETYAVEDWVIAQNGRILTEEWTEGFGGGMGNFAGPERNDYYIADGIDASVHPYLRPRPAYDDTATSDANLDPDTFPVYTFIAEDSASVPYLYILNGQYTHKYKISNMVLEEKIDQGANAVCGRPVLFKSKWYVPLGANVDYVQLATINTTGNADTWTTIIGGTADERKAIAFASSPHDGVARAAIAKPDSKIAFSTDLADTTAQGGTNEIGDKSTEIVDLWEWLGEYIVVKTDSFYRMDRDGNAFPVQTFVGSSTTPAFAYHGANSFVHGPYFFWAHESGIWRYKAPNVEPIGFEASPTWVSETDLGSGFDQQIAPWLSVAAYGRWIYATMAEVSASSPSHLYYGYIRDDGTVRWYGSLLTSAHTTTDMRITITADGGPRLWIFSTASNRIRAIDLEQDGSIRSQTGIKTTDTVQIWMPQVDFGEPEKVKQLRRFWVSVKRISSPTTVEAYVYRDWKAVEEQVGSAMSFGNPQSSYIKTVSWTPGTDDLFTVLRPSLKLVGGNQDVLVRAFGIVVATAALYRITIMCTEDGLKSGQTVDHVMQTLRNLLDAGSKTFKEPEKGGPAASWPGWVVGYTENPIKAEDDADEGIGGGYRVTLTVQRFEYGS